MYSVTTARMDPQFSPQPASMSGKNFIRSTVGQHPGTTAVVIAILVFLILVLAYYLVHYKSKCAAKSGFDCGAPSSCAGACGPGETSLVQANCDGSTTSWCRNTDALPGPPTVCGACWDPAATAEAEALATVGSLQHESYGERRLQRAINAAYDSNVGLSDEQLSNLMHQGGTP
jgi:hypothetical protein